MIELADDSEGVIGDFCSAIGAEFVAALQAARELASGFGDIYLALRIDEPFCAFDARSAEAAMGDAALGHYRRTLRSRWRAAHDARIASRSVDGASLQGQDVDTLERPHLDQLVRSGDIDEALAVLRSNLATPTAHRRVVRFLEEHGRFREAVRAAETAVKQHPGDRYLKDDLLRIYDGQYMFRRVTVLFEFHVIAN